MDFDLLANLSWREGLIAIVALLVLYVVVVFFRLRRLKRLKEATESPIPIAARSAVAAYAAVQDPDASQGQAASSQSAIDEPIAPLSELPFPWNEAPPNAPGQPSIDEIDRELSQLRKEVGGLRAELLAMRELLQRESLHRELSRESQRDPRHEVDRPSPAQSVSPLYSDAMQLAIQGHDAASISQHCGISRAEADLVVALGRNREHD